MIFNVKSRRKGLQLELRPLRPGGSGASASAGFHGLAEQGGATSQGENAKSIAKSIAKMVFEVLLKFF